MRAEQNGVRGAQFLNHFSDFNDLNGVEPDGRLVQNKNFRIVDQGLGQSHSLLVAFGQAPDDAVAHVSQSALFQHAVHGGGNLLFGNVAQTGREFEEFGNRHVLIQRRSFGQVADDLADFQ